jgi:hypothetical protein
MKSPRCECEFESDVLSAVLQSRWPDLVDDELRSHVAGCVICSDVAVIAGALDNARDETRASAVIPDSGRVWWMAQIRARREAIDSASRPITVAQAVALACAVGVLGACLGACLGASSQWFQETLKWIAAELTGIDLKIMAVAAAAFLVRHSAVVLGLAGVLLVVPVAFLLAIANDVDVRRE